MAKKLGALKSSSMRQTRLPDLASINAKFVVSSVFPVPPLNECNVIINGISLYVAPVVLELGRIVGGLRTFWVIKRFC